MNILMVHGINQSDISAKELKQQWGELLIATAKKNKLKNVPKQEDIFLFYYADITKEFLSKELDQVHFTEALESNNIVQVQSALQKLDKTQAIVLHEILLDFLHINSFLESKLVEELIISRKDNENIRLPQDDFARLVLWLTKHLPGFQAKLIKKFVKEAALYINNKDYRIAVLNKFKSFFDDNFKDKFDGEIVLVGHSLGSVVSYDFLKKFVPIKVKRIVTLGSPLGLDVFYKGCNSHQNQDTKDSTLNIQWDNLYSVTDPVSASKIECPPYKVNPKINNSRLITNYFGPHNCENYLNHKKVAKAILDKAD